MYVKKQLLSIKKQNNVNKGLKTLMETFELYPPAHNPHLNPFTCIFRHGERVPRGADILFILFKNC